MGGGGGIWIFPVTTLRIFDTKFIIKLSKLTDSKISTLLHSFSLTATIFFLTNLTS